MGPWVRRGQRRLALPWTQLQISQLQSYRATELLTLLTVTTRQLVRSYKIAVLVPAISGIYNCNLCTVYTAVLCTSPGIPASATHRGSGMLQADDRSI